MKQLLKTCWYIFAWMFVSGVFHLLMGESLDTCMLIMLASLYFSDKACATP